MATVRFGRLLGPVGFSRTVAIKCLHPHLAKDPEFSAMFLDEARLAARIRHPNVVPILDVVALEGELFLVMDYVQGESLSRLLRSVRASRGRVPTRVVATIMTGVLDGLHAAHEALNEQGEPLDIVHRDISPQNIMVGLDGIARVLDFGVAKAAGRVQSTRDGQLKGKLPYMAPEQLRGAKVDRRTDVYAASVVLWETLTGRRLFQADDEIGIFGQILEGAIAAPSSVIPTLPKGYDDVTLRGLSGDPAQRWATARDMAVALEKVAGVASAREVGAWVEQIAKDTLVKRAERVAEVESVSSTFDIQRPMLGLAADRALPEPPTIVSDTTNSRSGLFAARSDVSRNGPAPAVPSAPQTPSRTPVIIAIVAGVVALGLGFTIAVMSKGRGDESADKPAVEVARPIEAPVQEPAAVVAPPPVEPAPVAIASESPSAVMSAPPARTVSKQPIKTSPASTTPRPPATAGKPPPTAAPPAKADCNPPYTIDSRGVRVPKPQCL